MVSITVLSAMLPLVFGDAESDAAASILDGMLTGQNRAAKPEPFLDRIAALFGGGNKNQNKGKKINIPPIRRKYLSLENYYRSGNTLFIKVNQEIKDIFSIVQERYGTNCAFRDDPIFHVCHHTCGDNIFDCWSK